MNTHATALIVGTLLVGCVATDATEPASTRLASYGVDRIAVSHAGDATSVELIARDGSSLGRLDYGAPNGDDAHAQVNWNAITYDLDTTATTLAIVDARGARDVARFDAATESVTWDSGAAEHPTQMVELVAAVASEVGAAGPWLLPELPTDNTIAVYACVDTWRSCRSDCEATYGGFWGVMSGQHGACYTGCEYSWRACVYNGT